MSSKSFKYLPTYVVDLFLYAYEQMRSGTPLLEVCYYLRNHSACLQLLVLVHVFYNYVTERMQMRNDTLESSL
jgi:hypothetical protein